jgi:hypothetical protein
MVLCAFFRLAIAFNAIAMITRDDAKKKYANQSGRGPM